MALPPRGDPRRAIHLAIRSMIPLGIVFVLVGLGLIVEAGIRTHSRGGGAVEMVKDMCVVAFIYLLPGILYVLFAIFLRQRQSWAVIASLALVSYQALIPTAGVLGAAVLADGPSWLLIVFIIWDLALAQLLYLLGHSFASIRAYQESMPRGFEPLPATHLQPPTR